MFMVSSRVRGRVLRLRDRVIKDLDRDIKVIDKDKKSREQANRIKERANKDRFQGKISNPNIVLHVGIWAICIEIVL